MDRRDFLLFSTGLLGSFLGVKLMAMTDEQKTSWNLTDAEWRKRLTPEAYNILREEGTESPFSSSLNNEKRQGTFICVGCELPLFSSNLKYDSGTGWPSFFDVLPNAIGTKKDLKLIWPRTEYHCVRCGGHHGHIFNDGPKPTGLRYCNNGLALRFIPT